MTPYEQIDALQVMASRRVLTWMSRLALTLAVGLATGGILTLHPAFFMLLLLAVTIAYASATTSPHILNAAIASTSGARTQGRIKIDVTEGLDSPIYHAHLLVPHPIPWRIKFIPMGWQPIAGIHEATIFTLPNVAWPALVQLSEGILYPREKPTRVDNR